MGVGEGENYLSQELIRFYCSFCITSAESAYTKDPAHGRKGANAGAF